MHVFPRFRLHHVALNSDWFIALFAVAMIGRKINRMKMMYIAEMLYDDNNNNAQHMERRMFSRVFGCMNRTFARWRHFTTTTRILFVFPFVFKFCNPSEV